MQNFRRLLVWRKAHALAVQVDSETQALGRRDRAGIAAQARRAALSIPSNIAEGCGRSSDKDFAKFVQVAIASANELEYQLEYMADTKMLRRAEVEPLLARTVEVRRMLHGLLKRLKA